jgi:phage terminase small subunit
MTAKRKPIPKDVDELHSLPEMQKLSGQRRAFVMAKIFGGLSNRDAAIAAGYSASSKEVASAHGSRVAADPEVVAACDVLTRLVMRSTSIAAVRKLEYLMDNAEDEKLQAQCARDLLDRSGFNPSMRYDVVHHHELTLDEANATLAHLLAKAGLDQPTVARLTSPEAVIDADFSEVEPEPAVRSAPEQIDIEDYAEDAALAEGREGLEDIL